MALFELDEGRLVRAQFGHEVQGAFTPEVLAAIREQVLEIVGRPLFPITWRDVTRGGEIDTSPRLTALDASGQVVAVEVVERLGSDLLIDSLSCLADTAAMSWADLAREYPGDIEGFKIDWMRFRESMPPSPPGGPRLILVTCTIDDDVRPALEVLSSSGVEVHEMSMRQMSNGRAFLDVREVGPRLYGHRINTLIGTGSIPALPAPESDAPKRTAAPLQTADYPDVMELREAKSAKPSRSAQTLPDTLSSPAPESSQPRVDTSSHGLPSRRSLHSKPIPVVEKKATIGRDYDGLKAVSAFVGGEILLWLRPVSLTPQGALLSDEGRIITPQGDFTDPGDALAAAGLSTSDAWRAWHLGEESGPTLAEAINELNHQD